MISRVHESPDEVEVVGGVIGSGGATIKAMAAERGARVLGSLSLGSRTYKPVETGWGWGLRFGVRRFRVSRFRVAGIKLEFRV